MVFDLDEDRGFQREGKSSVIPCRFGNFTTFSRSSFSSCVMAFLIIFCFQIYVKYPLHRHLQVVDTVEEAVDYILGKETLQS